MPLRRIGAPRLMTGRGHNRTFGTTFSFPFNQRTEHLNCCAQPFARLVFAVTVIGSWTSAAAAQAWPPPAGKPVDVSRTVRLLDAPPTPCVSIQLDKATVLLSRSELLAQARESSPSAQDEEARTAVLERLSANRLLQRLTDAKDSFGCASLREAPIADDQRTAGAFLERGRAYVALKTTNAPVSEVKIRYLADDIQGNVMFYLPSEKGLFFALSWWVR